MLLVTCPLSKDSYCPICLQTHLCPYVSKCGHIFCITCIEKYLEYEGGWCYCPICQSTVNSNYLKPCFITYITEELNANNKIQFNLIEQINGSVICYPVLDDDNNKTYEMKKFKLNPLLPLIEPYSSKNSIKLYYTKYVIMTNDYYKIYLINYLNQIDELSKRYHEDGEDIYDEILEKEKNITFIMLSTINEEIEKNINTENSLKIDIDPTKNLPKFYFYQSVTSLPIFLHPFCFKNLLYEYGNDYNNLPLKIQSDIVEIDNIQVLEETKSQYKLLRHFPIGSFIQFCEVNMRKLVSKESFNLIKNVVYEREKERKKKEYKQKKILAKTKIIYGDYGEEIIEDFTPDVVVTNDMLPPLPNTVATEDGTTESGDTADAASNPVNQNELRGIWGRINNLNEEDTEEKKKKKKWGKFKGKGKLLFSY